jgi:hypothetical protein
MSHRCSLVEIALGTLPGQCPYPGDVTGPFRDADRSSGIEDIEQMG